MRLLLFLSAILSALAGAVTGGRAASPPAGFSRLAEPVTIAARVVAAAPLRPICTTRGPATATRSLGHLPFALAPCEPVYASRRRE